MDVNAIDRLAQEIRRVDGSNSLGAAALAEALQPFLAAQSLQAAPEWMPIDSAPRDARILVYNAVTGPYFSTFKDGEWPMHGWGEATGTWYPSPSHWYDLPASPAPAGG